MGIRLQPQDIEVSQSDPFAADRLARRDPIEFLTSIIGSIDGPCVLAVDAGWGSGKTVFLKMWAQHLRNERFPVVEFNSWETDFTGQPFVALSTELTDEITRDLDTSTGVDLKGLKKSALNLLRSPFSRAIARSIPHAGESIATLLESIPEEYMERYAVAKKAIADFKAELLAVAGSLAKSREGKPLVIVIDELDRCRPTYAIELLEVAKHLFNVDGVIFVLAIDRLQLAHSVGALYGESFDSSGYLKRFFDVVYKLPEPSRQDFITALMESTGLSDAIQKSDSSSIDQVLRSFLANNDVSLRDVHQALHHLGLILASRSEPMDQDSAWVIMSVLLILRTVDEPLYLKFVTGRSTDQEVIARLLESPKTAEPRPIPPAALANVLVEAVILRGIVARGLPSAVLESHRAFRNGGPNRSEIPHAIAVLRLFDLLTDRDFDRAVGRLELIQH